MRHLYSYLLCLAWVAASAMQTGPPRLAIRARRVWDGKAQAAIKDGVVLTEGTLIVAVGTNLPIPEGAQVLDLGDATVLPGLMDVHTHLLIADLDPRDEAHQLEQIFLPLATQGTAYRALVGAAHAKAYLEAGITTVRDLGNSGLNGDVALRDAIRHGLVPGPRMLVSTRALAPLGGQFPRLTREAQPLEAQEYAEVATPMEALRATREAINDGADCIKVIVDQRNSLGAEELKAIVGEAHRVGLKVAAHAISPRAVDAAIAAGVDSIEHAYRLTEPQARAMAEQKIYLVPTDFPARDTPCFATTPGERTHLEAAMERARQRLAMARRLGVPIAMGSDAYFRIGTLTRGEAARGPLLAYTESGFSPVDALRTATSGAADLLGLGQQVGTLEPGKVADLLAVQGDVLKDITAIEKVLLVVQGGHIVVQKP